MTGEVKKIVDAKDREILQNGSYFMVKLKGDHWNKLAKAGMETHQVLGLVKHGRYNADKNEWTMCNSFHREFTITHHLHTLKKVFGNDVIILQSPKPNKGIYLGSPGDDGRKILVTVNGVPWSDLNKENDLFNS